MQRQGRPGARPTGLTWQRGPAPQKVTKVGYNFMFGRNSAVCTHLATDPIRKVSKRRWQHGRQSWRFVKAK